MSLGENLASQYLSPLQVLSKESKEEANISNIQESFYLNSVFKLISWMTLVTYLNILNPSLFNYEMGDIAHAWMVAMGIK